MEAVPPLQAKLAEVQRQGTRVAGVIKELQQYRRQQTTLHHRNDLNRVLEAALQALEGTPRHTRNGLPFQVISALNIEAFGDFLGSIVPVSLELDPHPLSVAALAADLKRLCTFLLLNSAAAMAPLHGRLTVRTGRRGSKVLLEVEDTGPRLAPALLEQIFEPWSTSREETNPLELAACQSLVRRLQGTIQARNLPEAGVTILVELPQAQ
jgi:C4-dicarboxylate-specific signal transduction histidine kinase